MKLSRRQVYSELDLHLDAQQDRSIAVLLLTPFISRLEA